MTTDGTYDWTRDGPGTYYLQAAQSANVSSITFFVNAAPSALTAELAPCGTTLTSSAIVPFVSYIATVVSHWASQGIRIDYISPMNEPDNSFFKCTQEGMAIPTSTRAQVFQALRAALASSAAPNVKILGDETSQIASQALNEYDEWLPDTLSSIDSIAVHMYDWPDDATLLNYAQFVKTLSLPNPPPPIKMTEISSFQSAAGMHAPWGWTGPKIMGAQFDPGMDSALDMARMIWQWLTLVNAEEWDWWTAVSKEMPCSPSGGSGAAGCQFTPNAGWNDGLVYIDPAYQTTHNYNFYLPKRYWVFRHFSKFHRPGAVRYDIPNESLPYGTVAFASKAAEENGGMWSTVFVNRNFTAQEIRLRVPEKGFVVKEVVQTTEKVDWGTVPLPAVGTDGIVRLELPSRGVLTVRLGEEGTIAQRVVGRGWAGGGKEVGNR